MYHLIRVTADNQVQSRECSFIGYSRALEMFFIISTQPPSQGQSVSRVSEKLMVTNVRKAVILVYIEWHMPHIEAPTATNRRWFRILSQDQSEEHSNLH